MSKHETYYQFVVVIVCPNTQCIKESVQFPGKIKLQGAEKQKKKEKAKNMFIQPLK
jgi:hypothetical protein